MKDTIMEMPDYQRPYEKCLREGEQSLSDRGASCRDPALWRTGIQFPDSGR